jgi:hypothetical protein
MCCPTTVMTVHGPVGPSGPRPLSLPRAVLTRSARDYFRIDSTVLGRHMKPFVEKAHDFRSQGRLPRVSFQNPLALATEKRTMCYCAVTLYFVSVPGIPSVLVILPHLTDI